MSDEITQEQQVDVPEPETEPAPQSEPVEDVSERLKALESELGKRANEIGSLKEELQRATSQVYPQQQANYWQGNYPQQQQPQQEQVPAIDYNDLEGSIYRASQVPARQSEERVMNFLHQTRLQDNVSRAASALEDARTYMNQNEKLFGGIEDKVAEQVSNVFIPLAQRGVQVEQALRNRETYENIAATMRWRQGEIDRLAKDGHPVRPVSMEAPQQRVSASDVRPDIQYSESDLRMMKDLGLTKEQADKITLEQAKREGVL